MATDAQNLSQPQESGVKKGEWRITRPPVVVVLGHIDHGKTTLLDQIRQTHVADKESGGITQHIGAYEVECQNKKITFIDTPGHEAFSAIRSRSASVADIALLVVAADEGVKTQTKEAISHIKKTGIEPIVVINKIDKPEADPEKVKRELAKEEIMVESMGGNIPSVNVSAKTGQGITDLLELILLVAEMKNLTANALKPAEGIVIEAYLDSQRGPTATLLVKDGILNEGEIIGTKSFSGKVKRLLDFKGTPVNKAMSSMPAVTFGLDGMPGIGEEFKVFPNLESAQAAVESVEEKPIRATVLSEPTGSVLHLILKADFLGSLEAIREILNGIPQEKVALQVLKAEVGDINESDIKMAKETRAKILGFRTKTSFMVRNLAEREKIRIIDCAVIYDFVEIVRRLMEKTLEPETKRLDLGKLKVLVIFLTEKTRQIIGGKVVEGEVRKGTTIEVFRNEEKIGAGKIINLQRDKKDIDKIVKGGECGILYEGNTKIEVGDILAIYIEERRRIEL